MINYLRSREGEIRTINGTKFYKHGDDVVTITGNARCTNGDCPYINEVGDCPGNIENCEYRQQSNDAFIHYTFDGI